MVSSEGDDARVNSSSLAETSHLLHAAVSVRLMSDRVCGAMHELLVTNLHLLDRESRVVGRDGTAESLVSFRSSEDGPEERTHTSPQSTSFAQDLKGLTARGTLYPPYRVKRREP